MLIDEAKWFGQTIDELKQAKQLLPLLNLGSSTLSFRKNKQPWIEKYIFSKLPPELVKHVDIKKGQGVDLVGDIMEPAFFKQIKAMQFKSVLCQNLLEHVVTKEKLTKKILALLPPGGLIFVSCPFVYPYHPDPIDTGFRPNVEELANLFAGAKVIKAAIVKTEKVISVKDIARAFFPFYKPKNWLGVVAKLRWQLDYFAATCLVLEK